MARLTELEKWWTPGQVQSYTGYSRQGVLDFAREGVIRAAFVGKEHKEHGRGQWIYDPESVAAFVKKRGIKEQACARVEAVADDKAGYEERS